MNIGSRPLVSREFNHSKLCETGEEILCLRQYFCVFIQSFFWFSFSLALTSNEGDRLFQLGRLFSPFLFNTAIVISYYNKCSGIQWQPKYGQKIFRCMNINFLYSNKFTSHYQLQYHRGFEKTHKKVVLWSDMAYAISLKVQWIASHGC